MQIIRKSMKLTEKRKKLLSVLGSTKGLISARALAKKVPSMDQATVYRNLDLFVKEGEVRKFLFDGTEAVYERAHDNHHHAVCDNCEKVLHFDVSKEEILKTFQVKGFDVSSVELVVRGVCK